MEQKIIFKCQLCKHYYDFGMAMCEAFQEIPKDIYSGAKDHAKPIKGQKNKIVFELKDDIK